MEQVAAEVGGRVHREADGNARLRQAVHRYAAASRKGVEERLFTLAFSGLVYAQIWEDPEIDLEALSLSPGERLIAIASGGCNLLSYLARADVEVVGLDLNPAHVALNTLKQTALRVIDSHETYARFFADANHADNVRVYERELRPHLDAVTRKYWEGRDRLGRRRINYFTDNVFTHGLLGRFIAAGHALAKLNGADPSRILEAKTRAEQIEIFEREIAPLFTLRHIRWITNKPASLFGLGIPPQQFEALKGDETHMAAVLHERLYRLACGFDLKDNYFASQAFGRGYRRAEGGPLPPYLDPKNWEALKSRADKVSITHASFAEHLQGMGEATLDAYVLLDAQDWMTDEQLTTLWTEIVRTSRPGARVIFRTAGEESILPGRLPQRILERFSYSPEQSRAWTARDRSSIYGGFHLYRREA